MKKIIALLMFCGTLLLQAAEKKNTIQRFGEGDMQVIRTKVRFTTLIVLPEGEEISEVVCGDKEYWVIEGKDSIVYVKPAKEGAFTNVNIISKNKAVYSFLVQEITKAGSSKEKPDLKIVLGNDELAKLRKDKDNLEELLARTESSVKDLKEKADAEKAKKKDETDPPKIEAPKIEVTLPEPKAAQEAKLNQPISAPASQILTAEAKTPPPPAATTEPEAPSFTVRVTKVERQDGLIRKTGRFFGRLFRRVSETLRIY